MRTTSKRPSLTATIKGVVALGCEKRYMRKINKNLRSKLLHVPLAVSQIG
jgi:hypothetical protein